MPVDGLAFDRAGRDGGPALLLIHPMGADRHFWAGCVAHWAADWPCISVDLRGCGASPAATAPATPEDHAADLEDLRRALGLSAWVPVGCAVGAMVATAYAGRHPSRCAGLVLTNPGMRTRPEARAMLAGRAAAVRAGGMAAIADAAISAAFAGCPDTEARERFRTQFLAQDPAAYALQIEGMLSADMSQHLRAITCPTLVVAGGADRLLPPDHASQIAAGLPDCTHVEIPGGAHFLPYQQPDRIAGIVADFLHSRLGWADAAAAP